MSKVKVKDINELKELIGDNGALRMSQKSDEFSSLLYMENTLREIFTPQHENPYPRILTMGDYWDMLVYTYNYSDRFNKNIKARSND
jgi:hypothetical protein